MKTKNLFIVLSIFGSIVIASCSKEKNTNPIVSSDDAIPVKIVSLNKTDINGHIFSSGQFTTNDETFLSFKTGGIINKIYVKEGDVIQKGQLLATIDLTEINAQMNQAQLAFEKANRDYKRAENLYKDSVVTLEQFQNTKTGFDIAQQQLAGIKFNMQYSEIRAISDGVVLKKITNDGQIVGPGTPVLQTSSKGQTDWILRLTVSDKEWAQAGKNDKAIVQVEALNIKNIEGFVYSKSENADLMTGSFSIDIKLKNAEKLNIASGMFGKAKITVSGKNNIWQIPYESLLDGNAGSGFVFVTNDNKTAQKIPVTIAAIDKNMVIISEGLQGYSSLIISGSAYLTENSSIKISNN